jgi:ABC-type phosphate transport system substrate-binding protein
VWDARLIALAVTMATLAGSLAGAAEPIAVVVGRDSPITGVTPDTLREVYLRRQRVWPDGSRVIPVNLPVDSPARRTFSEEILGRSPRELGGYWNRRWFEGVRPPLVLQTPKAVCAYVAVEPTAIGYVEAGVVDPATCRVLLELSP